MSILRIINNLDQMSDAGFLANAKTIEAAMTGNPHFSTPTPTMAELGTAIADYESALAAAAKGSSLEKGRKNEKRAKLTELLHHLGNYVLFTAKGNRLVAQSSGFTIAKEPSAAPELEKPRSLVLEEGATAGQLKLRFKRPRGVRSYLYQYTPDPLTPTSEWKSQYGTVSRAVLSGLTSKEKYWVRVVAIGVKNQQTIGDPVSKVVQ